MSIWKTQEVHDAACRVLGLHTAAGTATHALVEVLIPGFGTTAALMQKDHELWTIQRLYTAEHELPGAVAVIVVGLW